MRNSANSTLRGFFLYTTSAANITTL